jgi:hypothetical protein
MRKPINALIRAALHIRVTTTILPIAGSGGLSTIMHASDCAYLLLYNLLYRVNAKCQDGLAALEAPGWPPVRR